MSINSNFKGVLRINPINSRYFTDNTGKAVYLTGSHTWAVMQDMWLENRPRKNMDYDCFLQMLKDNGHNFMRFWQWMQVKNAAWSEISTNFDPQPFARTGPGNAKDGFARFDLSKWNDSYFERLRERIEKAAQKSIYVSIMLFEAGCIKSASSEKDDPWPYHPMHPDNNINNIVDNPILNNGRAWNFYTLLCPQLLQWQKEFVKKIIDTVNDFDNVLFEICNEIPNCMESMEWQDHMCDFIHKYESSKPKQHPVGITAEGGNQENQELFATCADWISPGNGRLYEYRYNPPAAQGSKVIITDTDHLWGHGCEIEWIWKSFTRGMNVIFMDPWEPIPRDMDIWQDGNITLNQRYYYTWDPVRRNLGYTRHFALRMDLNRCVPHNELCTSTFCLANPDVEYLFYFASGGYEGLDLRDASGIFEVEWFNPVTGVTVKGNNITGGYSNAIHAPFEGAAVLYIYKT